MSEAQVRPAQERDNFLKIFAAAPVALLLLDPDAVITKANASIASLVLRDIDEIVGKRLGNGLSCIHGLQEGACGFDSACSACPLRRIVEIVLAGGIATHDSLVKVTLQLGGKPQPRWLRVSAEPVELGDKRHVVLAVDDVTKRVRAEESLQERTRFADKLFDSTPLATWVSDERGTATKANRAFLDLFGVTEEEIIGRYNVFEDVVLAREGAMPLVRRAFDTGEPTSFLLDYELVSRQGSKEESSRRFVSITLTPIVDVDGRLGSVVFQSTDLTQLRRAEQRLVESEQQLHHAQKMEAIGTLAGGVAHDFNNILGGVLSGLSVLELELGELADSHRVDFDEMKALIKRGGTLTNRLLGLGRRGKFDARPLHLREVVRETMSMFARTRRDITLQQELAPDLRPVLMDHAQLEQVLLNLFLNAGQAMPNEGRLTVSAANRLLTEDDARPLGLTAGPFVELAVADTGVGMDETTKARAFEPFFTTKAAAGGTGLGLASVYGIVKNHGGAISVASAPAHGTTFTILLPTTDQPVEERIGEATLARRGHETILVVDDEPQLLHLCARLLRAMGYEVLSAASGEEALALVRKHGPRISVVILDMTMPEMSGARTYEAIRSIAPKLKVLLASGFAADGQAQELLARGCSDFIQKPFDVAALSAKLQALL